MQLYQCSLYHITSLRSFVSWLTVYVGKEKNNSFVSVYKTESTQMCIGMFRVYYNSV